VLVLTPSRTCSATRASVCRPTPRTVEGRQHPDRDAQFRYIDGQVTDHQGTADPVISVDTKKKELVGQFTNPGRQWRPSGEPVPTLTHDFPGDTSGKAVPYGIYDLTANTGWVNVGTDHDTAAFAVESIRRWWTSIGRDDYPGAHRLLITADAGGSQRLPHPRLESGTGPLSPRKPGYRSPSATSRPARDCLEADGELVVAGGHCAVAFESGDAVLDGVAEPVELRVECRRAAATGAVALR
jgi:DDE family transposase